MGIKIDFISKPYQIDTPLVNKSTRTAGDDQMSLRINKQ